MRSLCFVDKLHKDNEDGCNNVIKIPDLFDLFN